MGADGELSEALAAFQRGDVERARALAERRLAADPSSPSLHHLLGLIDCRCGRFADGVQRLRRAVDAEPGNAAFRVMLVRALVDSGQAKEALDAAARPQALAAAELPLWQARAEAAGAAGDSVEATEAWRAICSIAPGDWRAWLNLGRGLLKLRRFDEAAQAYETALGLSGPNVDIIAELGLVYERTDRVDRLSSLLDSPLAAGIDKAGLAELWAIRAQHEQRYDEARAYLDEASPVPNPARWHARYAKIEDAAGDAAAAFSHAAAMNRATPDFDEWRVKSAEYRRLLRDTADTITADLPQLPPCETRCPAFLLGFPRSGTTLLDTFLMGHPDIAVIEEKGLLQGVAQGLDVRHAPPDMLQAARDSYLSGLGRYLDPAFAGVVIDKAPLNMLLAPLIHSLFPGAPIIFAQRHPCDAVLSGFMQSFESNLGMASFLDIVDAADFYDACMSVWTASREALPLNLCTVTYEKLVRDPERELRPVVAFLGLKWDAQLLDHQATARARGPILNTSYDQVGRPLTTAASGRWRRYERQLEPVLPLLLGWAERLGY
jgi:Flp pilus assembly protein TadD